MFSLCPFILFYQQRIVGPTTLPTSVTQHTISRYQFWSLFFSFLLNCWHHMFTKLYQTIKGWSDGFETFSFCSFNAPCTHLRGPKKGHFCLFLIVFSSSVVLYGLSRDTDRVEIWKCWWRTDQPTGYVQETLFASKKFLKVIMMIMIVNCVTPETLI